MRTPCRPRRPYSWAIHRAGSWRRCCSDRSSASTSPRDSVLLAHDLIRKPVPTFRDHALVLFYQILAEGCGRRKLFAGRPHIGPLAREILGYRPPQRRIGDEMRGIGGHRQVAARQLVLALGAGLDARQSVGDRVFDGLIVAQLEMQKRMVLDGAPVAPVDRIDPEKIDGAGNPAPGAAGHHQQDAVAHLLADDREEFAGKVGPAPFARAGVHVEGEKGVPHRFGEIGAGEPDHLDAGLQRLLALAADGLAFAGREAAEEVVEAGVAGIHPMELLVVALQEAALADALVEITTASELSSAHVTFLTEPEWRALGQE